MIYNSFLQRFIKRSIIIFSIGDKGSIITIFKQGSLVSRTFARVDFPEEVEAIRQLLAKEPELPIYVLLDILDQSFNTQTLPSVSSLTINNIVKKKLERTFPEDNLKAYQILGKSDDLKNEWQYLLISVAINGQLSIWLETILNYPNPFKGIYTLPIELTSLQRKLNQHYLASKNASDSRIGQNKWQLLICHNKLGGFRQVAYKNDNVAFTRLINSAESDSIDFMAGNIEQEISNSLEYLQRLGYKKEDNLDIIIISSAEMKSKLKSYKFKALNTILLTPFEIAEKLGLSQAALPEDKYSDVVIAANFAHSNPILILKDNAIGKLILFERLKSFINIPTIVILPILIVYLVILSYDIYILDKDIKLLQGERTEIMQEWGKYQDIAKEQKSQLKIVELVQIYKKLIGNYQAPFNILEKMRAIIGDAMTISSIDWKYVISTSKNVPSNVVAVFKFNVNKDDNQQQYNVFQGVDKFIKNLTSTFVGYNVDYNRTNEKIDFNKGVNSIPLQITISGPKIE